MAQANSSLLAKTKATTYTAGTDLTFDEPDLATTFTVPSDGMLRLSFAVSGAVTMMVRHNSVNLLLEKGSLSVAEAMYGLTVELAAGETFSLRFGGNTTVRYYTISYVEGPLN